MPQFFIEDNDISGDTAFIRGENFHHLANVRRVRRGDVVMLRSGSGRAFEAKIVLVGDSSIECDILKSYDREQSSPSIKLCLALLKGGSFDTALQKAVEVGVTSVVPVISERTVPDIDKKIQAKIQRWEKIVLEASKQCLRDSIPDIYEPHKFNDILSVHCDGQEKILAHPGAQETFRDYSRNCTRPESVSVLVGPEGGFSDAELESARQNGWRILNFGRNHLRAETAAVVIPSVIVYEWR